MIEARITPAEERIMLIVWKYGDIDLNMITILEKVNAIYNMEWKPQTVTTMLSRLVKKKYLCGYREGRSYYYYPLLSYDDYVEGEMHKILFFWFDGNKKEMLRFLN